LSRLFARRLSGSAELVPTSTDGPAGRARYLLVVYQELVGFVWNSLPAIAAPLGLD